MMTLSGLGWHQHAAAQTTYYWDGNGATTGSGNATLTGTWGSSAFWGTSATGTSATTAAAINSADTVVFSANDGVTNNNWNQAYTVTLNGNQSVNGLVIGGASVGSNTTGGILTLAASGNSSLTVGAGGISLNGASADPTFASSLNVIVGANQTWSANVGRRWFFNSTIQAGASAVTLTLGNATFTPLYSGVISNGNASGTLSLKVDNAGTGAHTISGVNNSYTGKTTIAQGSLTISLLKNVNGGVSSLGAVTSAANGTIDMGSGSLAATLIYNGTTASSSDRVINLAGTTGNATIQNGASATTSTLSFTSPLTNAGGGAKTLTLRGTNTGNNTFSGALGDAADTSKLALVKTDAGLWILGGANSYSGGTTISGGTLSVNASGTLGANVAGNNITINSGGNLVLSAASNFGANQTITLNSGGIGVAYTPASLPAVTDNTGAAGGVYGINYAGTGAVTSLTSLYNGNWFLGSFTSGTYTGASLGAGNGTTYRLGGGGGALTIQNGALAGANSLTVGGTGGGNVILTGANTFSGKTTIQNGTLSVGSLNRVSGGTASSNLGTPSNSTTGTIDIGSTTNTVSLNYTGSGETTDRVVNFAGTTGGVTLANSGTGNLVFANQPTFLGSGNKTLTLGAASDSFGGSIGALANPAGGTKLSVTKNGLSNSTWTLTGTSNYTGDTNINGGALAATDLLPNSYIKLAGTLSTNWAVFQSSGTLSRTISNTAASTNLGWGSHGGFAAKGGKLTLNFNGGAQIDWELGGLLGGGTSTMVFGSTTADSQVELVNAVGLNTADGFARPIYVEKGLGGDSALMSGALLNGTAAGSATGVTKQGKGTLILSGANTFSGAVVVSAGTLVAGVDSLANGNTTTSGAFGTGRGPSNSPTVPSTITLGDGSTGSVSNNPSVLIGGPFTVGRSITILDSGTGNAYSLGGSTDNNATFSGVISVTNSTASGNSFNVTQVATSGGNALNITGGIVGGATLGKMVTFNNVGAVNVSGGLITNGGANPLSVIQSGNGTTTLSGSNTYTGVTTLNAGVLNVGVLANIGLSSSIGAGSVAADLVINGGTLRYGGTVATSTNRPYTLGTNGGGFNASGTTAGTLTLSGNMTASGSTGSQALTLSGSGTGTAGGGTLSGTINNGTGSNTTAVTKTGTGLWTLAAANTYSGATTISGGTLALGAAGTLGTSSIITVGTTGSTGAVLDLSAKAGAFTLLSGQTLKGSGTVILGAGGLNVASGAHWAPGNSIGTNTVTGNLTLAGFSDFELGTTGVSHASSGLSDRTDVSGTLTLGGTLNLIDNAGANSNGSVAAGSYKIFTQSGTAGGAFSSVVDPSSSLHAKVDATSSGSVFVDVYRLATVNAISTSVSLGNIRVGGSFSPSALSIQNTASGDGFSEGLNASGGGLTGDATTSGSISNLSGGSSSNAVTVGLTNTATAGAKSGNVTVSLASNGTNSAHGNTALTAQTIAVSGNVFNAAAAGTLPATVDLGIIHKGGSFGSAALTISNGAAAGAFTEGLNASFGSTTGAAGHNSGSVSNLAGASFDASALQVSLSGNTSVAGSLSGTVGVNFASNGTNSGLSNLTLAAQSVSVSGQVNEYAQPVFSVVSGETGTGLSGNATHYTLNLGSFNTGSGSYSTEFGLTNSLLSASFQDALGGSFDLSGNGSFSLSGFGGPVSVVSGNTLGGLLASFDTTGKTQGIYTGSFLLAPTSINGSSTSSLSSITVDVQLTVIPEPGSLVSLLGGLGMLVALRRRRLR